MNMELKNWINANCFIILRNLYSCNYIIKMKFNFTARPETSISLAQFIKNLFSDV